MSINEWLTVAEKKLAEIGITTAHLDALILLEHALDTPRAALLAHFDMVLPATTLVRANELLAQRLDNIPIAYILQKKEFYGRDFIVNDHVLIPRPETEDMIEIVKDLSLETPTILDMGTGSGCIAITLALEVPNAKVIAVDISEDALDVAKLNSKHLHAQVTYKVSDMFAAISHRSFDIVCANLPYVPEQLVTSKEITKEPAQALFSGTDGLQHYRNFFSDLSLQEHTPRYVVTESLLTQHNNLKRFASDAGYAVQEIRGLIQLFVRQ